MNPTQRFSRNSRRPTEQPVVQLMEQSVEQPVEQLVEQFVEQPVEQPMEQPMEQFVEQPMKKSTYKTHKINAVMKPGRSYEKVASFSFIPPSDDAEFMMIKVFGWLSKKEPVDPFHLQTIDVVEDIVKDIVKDVPVREFVRGRMQRSRDGRLHRIDIISNVVEDVVAPVEDVVEDVVAPVKDVVEDVVAPVEDVVEDVVADVVAPVEDVVEDVVADVVDNKAFSKFRLLHDKTILKDFRITSYTEHLLQESSIKCVPKETCTLDLIGKNYGDVYTVIDYIEFEFAEPL